MDAQNYLEHDKKSTSNRDHQENRQQDKLISTTGNDKHKLSASPIASNHLNSCYNNNNSNSNHTITSKEEPKSKTAERDMIETKNVPAKDDNSQAAAQVNNCEPIEDNSSSGNIDNKRSGPIDDECQLSAEIERLEQEVEGTHQSMIERNAPSTLSPPEDYDNKNSGDKLAKLSKEQASKSKPSIDDESEVNKKTPPVVVASAPEPVQSEITTILSSMETNSNNSDSPAISQENSPREQQDDVHTKTGLNFSPESPPNTANSSPNHLSQSQVDQTIGETSTKIIDNNTNIEKVPDEEVSSALGRNRRVRQKNRYFLDFHCIDLVKGCRSKDDYDAYPSTGTGSATRSSNRRSTTDSSRSGLQEEEPEVFIDRYCRKCSNKTPHDFEDGCQVCLYKQIVLTNKRQKTSSQRSRSSRSQPQRPDNKSNNSESVGTTTSATTTSTPSTATTTSVPKASNSRTKRKASKQAGGPSKQSNNIELESDISLKKHADTIDCVELAKNTATASIGPKSNIAGDKDNDNNSSNNYDATSAQVQNKVAKLTATIKVDGNSSKSKWVIKPGRSQNDENVISICREVEHDIKHQVQQPNHHSTPAEDDSSNATNQEGEMILTNNNDNKIKITDACDMKAISNLNSNRNNISNNNNNDNSNSQMNGLELTHLDTWTPDQVAQYVSSKGFVSEAESFRAEAVDGISLLLMQRTDFTYGLKMKLGPALKLYDQVCKLKRDYFRDIATAS